MRSESIRILPRFAKSICGCRIRILHGKIVLRNNASPLIGIFNNAV